MALADNLVSYWKLDESSGNAADSVGSNTLTNVNTATYAAGKINNGVSLARASSQCLSIADASQSGLDISPDLSISLWFKLATLPGASEYYVLAGKLSFAGADSDTLTQYALWYDNASGRRLTFNVRGPGASSTLVHTATLNTGQWYHLTAVFTHSARQEIFLDGSSVASSTSSIPASVVNTAQPFRFGVSASDDSFLNGMVDEAGVWSRALSSGEVSQLYNSGSGLAYPFVSAYSLVAVVGSFALAGVDVSLSKATSYSLACAAASFSLSGSDVTLSAPAWTSVAANAASWTDESAASTAWTTA